MARRRTRNVIIVAPLGPAVGGIVSIAAMLHERLHSRPEILFIDSAKDHEARLRLWIRPIRLLTQLTLASMRVKRASVLIFCSAGSSFWEKGIWALISRVCGAQVMMVMVDGNFPAFYSSLTPTRRRLASFLIRNVHTLGTQSPWWEDYYSNTFPGIRTALIKAGVDTSRFSPSERPSAGVSVPRILCVGWMIPAKGVLDLIEATAILDQRGVDFQCRFVGPAFGRESYFEKLINDRHLKDKIVILGATSGIDSIVGELRSANIFVQPSHAEGFPVALLEAISTGLPCIATTVGGIPDLLQNGECGILVPPRNPMALADALEQLIHDPLRQQELGLQARRHAEKEHTLEMAFASYCDLLNIALRSNDQARRMNG